ncbi:MAG: cytochrome c [Gammaproteobacteria bacterium]|nr:cytochrome c [Gammaproteobacteria bacterium]
MIKIYTQLTLIVTMCLSQASVYSANIEQGKKLHSQSCTACHVSQMGGDGSKLYTRDNRRVTSLTALNQQVKRCNDNVGTGWFEDQINNVVHFLNTNYYKFPK